MPKIASLHDLRELRAKLQGSIEQRYQVGTTVVVGMGTCGIKAGARQTLQALSEELSRRGIEAHLISGGCIGRCADEPLVTIYQTDAPPVMYGKVTTEKVPELVETHLAQGQVIQAWVVETE